MYYDLPADIAAKAWGGKFRGQRQKWFVMMFNGDDQDINVRTEHPEFSAWRWVSPSELPKLAVSFKRRLYENALGTFSEIFRD
jgi:putative (di)nucleoside polyphosphate hydrolase